MSVHFAKDRINTIHIILGGLRRGALIPAAAPRLPVYLVVSMGLIQKRRAHESDSTAPRDRHCSEGWQQLPQRSRRSGRSMPHTSCATYLYSTLHNAYRRKMRPGRHQTRSLMLIYTPPLRNVPFTHNIPLHNPRHFFSSISTTAVHLMLEARRTPQRRES